MSDCVNVFRLKWPNVYGQITPPVHVSDAADALMLMMHCCFGCADVANALMLLMHFAADALLLLMRCCC